MKLLLLAFILAGSFCITDLEYLEQAGITVDEALELVDGILAGLDLNYDIENIKDCFEKSPPLIKKVIEIIQEFKAMDWKDLDKVLQLFADLFDGLKEILLLIKPCAKIGVDIEKLIEKLKNIDFEKLMDKILKNMFEFIALMTDCIKQFKNKEYKAAGEDIGQAVYKLLLEPVEDVLANDVENFFRGLFKGLHAESEFEAIKKCITDAESIIKRIVEAVKKILTLDPGKVIQGVMELIAAVKDLIGLLDPCISSTSILKKLLEKIMNVDIMKLVWRIISHIGSLIDDIKMIIHGFEGRDFEKVGTGLGNLLRELFLE
jgi:virulence-associated protein VapD